ncbi:MAG: phosphatase PAP2 family protein [Gemmatimonadaceae bacterium]
MSDEPQPPKAIGNALGALGAAVLFAWIARRVVSGRSEPLDAQARGVMQSHRSDALDAATRPVTLLSMPILVVTATAALAYWLRSTDRTRAAVAVAAAPILAATAGQSFTTFLPQRNPPDASDARDGQETVPSFPSGHTTGVTAEALTIAYVLLNEDLASPAIIGALAAWPLLVGITRVYRDRHWLSDVLGGWVAGAGVAALSAMLYRSPKNAQ